MALDFIFALVPPLSGYRRYASRPNPGSLRGCHTLDPGLQLTEEDGTQDLLVSQHHRRDLVVFDPSNRGFRMSDTHPEA